MTIRCSAMSVSWRLARGPTKVSAPTSSSSADIFAANWKPRLAERRSVGFRPPTGVAQHRATHMLTEIWRDLERPIIAQRTPANAEIPRNRWHIFNVSISYPTLSSTTLQNCASGANPTSHEYMLIPHVISCCNTERKHATRQTQPEIGKLAAELRALLFHYLTESSLPTHHSNGQQSTPIQSTLAPTSPAEPTLPHWRLWFCTSLLRFKDHHDGALHAIHVAPFIVP